MDNENKHNIIKSKYFLIPFIILTIIFIAIGSYSIKTVQEYFFNDKIRQAQKIANSYSYSFQKSNKAKEIINHLMEQKLTVAGRIIVSNDENNNNKFLAELKHILELDVIHYYNKEGVVTTSSNQRYIGWSPDEAHPINDFINSDKKIYIEDGSYAITKIESFGLNTKENLLERYLEAHKRISNSAVIEYAKQDRVWRINRVKYETGFQKDNSKRQVYYDTEYIVTEFKIEKVDDFSYEEKFFYGER
jgi:hypothetical protein